MPEMSIIVVNWNGKRFLEDCLGSLRRQTFQDFEAILVDNGSSDGSAEYIRSYFPEVKLVALEENRGFTGGNIAGYELAKGSIIVLLNNDTEADPAWLEEIHKASTLCENAGSFASKMMYFDARNRIENCGFDMSTFGATLELGRDQLDGPEWKTPRQVFGACGGAVAYRRSMLDRIGFLDPEFFMVYEDVDLSFRAQLHGYPCIYIPTAIVFHRYRASLGSGSARQVFYSQRNIEFVYFKNMPFSLILRSLPQRLIYELGAAIHCIGQGNAGPFVRSKLSAIKHLSSMWRKRWRIQQSKKMDPSQLRSLMKPVFSSKWKKLRSSLGKAFNGLGASQSGASQDG
jgi:GT2 family glycosyltransferase